MKRRKIYWAITLIIIFSLILLSIFKKPEEEPLSITMLDIGQGDAIYIETPNGQNMLVDSGRDRSILSSIDPYVGFKDKIDVIENSNPDLDHIGGFPFVIEKYNIGKIISAGTNHQDLPAFKKIEELAKENKIDIDIPKQGTVYVLDPKAGVTYTILWPEGNVRNWERNAGSIVGLLEYGEHKVLLTGDAPKEVEDQVMAKYRKDLQNIDILKVGHHGSRTSTGENLLKTTNPKYAIISAGLNNFYGHPHKEVVNLLEKYKIKTLVTSEEGTIECNIFLHKEVVCK
jgi:competence protein ComEC